MMAPIGDKDVQALQDSVQQLQARVKELEDKLEHVQTGSKPTPPKSVRMILMGPPGAGMRKLIVLRIFPNTLLGKGTQAPNIRDKFSCCHLVGS